MRLNPEDPRLMDLALGELSEAEVEELNEALKLPENEAARKAVDDFRALSGYAAKALAAEPADALHEAQRQAVVDAARAPRARGRSNIVRWMGPLATAATLLVGVGLVYGFIALRGPFATKMAEVAPSFAPQAKPMMAAPEPPAPAADAAVDLADGPVTYDASGREQLRYLAEGPAPAEEPAEADHFGALEVEAASEAVADVDNLAAMPPVSLVTEAEAPPAPMPQAMPAPTRETLSAELRRQGGAVPMPEAAAVNEGVMAGAGGGGYGGGNADGMGGMMGGMGALGRPSPTSRGVSPEEKPKSEPVAMGQVAAGSRAEARERLEALGYKGEAKAGDVSSYAHIVPTAPGAPVPPEGAEWHYRDLDAEGTVLYETILPQPLPRRPQPGGERYAPITENPFEPVERAPLSTFSVDVDTGSYSNVRRFVEGGTLPPPNAVRIEEMVNYFDYHDPAPTGGNPFAVRVEVAACPWQPEHLLARIGVRGRDVPRDDRPAGNFVFLLDVSGSMRDANKLPLVKESMKALLDELEPRDRVGIVTYASRAGVYLHSTACEDKAGIRSAIDALEAGGSTNGSGGIQQAYAMAKEHFITGGANRVILATDGDFNVGVTDLEQLLGLIQEHARSNVFLTALGFGMGNLKDETLERLADTGNGNYAYIDSFTEARKVLVEELTGTLITIAKDVKIQVEFNPAAVGAYRLLGYENRALAARDFNDDTKDAGEIGAGHAVTALYELVPAGYQPVMGVDDLRYQPEPEPEPVVERPAPAEWMNVKLRYKHPEGSESAKIEVPVPRVVAEAPSDDFRFSAAVAAFSMILRHSEYAGNATGDLVVELARGSIASDAERQAFADLVVTAKTLGLPR